MKTRLLSCCNYLDYRDTLLLPHVLSGSDLINLFFCPRTVNLEKHAVKVCNEITMTA